MEIAAALAADLALLTEALDDPGVDISSTLNQLGADAAAAVTSFLGLTVTIDGTDPPLTLTVMGRRQPTEPTESADQPIRTSLLIPLSGRSGGSAADGSDGADVPVGIDDTVGADGVAGHPVVAVVLYAATHGAFVDLAADLSWLTGIPLTGIDQHLVTPADVSLDGRLRDASAINQALGVLIGQGYTLDQIEGELATRAETAGTDIPTVARRILDELSEG